MPCTRKAGPVLIDNNYCHVILLGCLILLGGYKLGGTWWGEPMKNQFEWGESPKGGMNFLDPGAGPIAFRQYWNYLI